MKLNVLVAIAAIVLSSAVARGADSTREVHGMSDAYSGAGVTLAWAILRGNDESKTLAVVRIVVDPNVFDSVGVSGVDPFTSRRKTLMKPARVAGVFDVPLPRPHFADLPRTEFRFFRNDADAQADTPALVVYYGGVPDTAPEFNDSAVLDKYLTDRIERARKERTRP